MVADRRRTRFSGGSLIAPVVPIPDELYEEPAAAPTPTPAKPTKPDVPTVPPRSGPPATLRINEAAGVALWKAYLTEKGRDPFLSLRQFTSHIVLQGLGKR